VGLPRCLGFLKLVFVLAARLSAGVPFGAYVPDVHDYNAYFVAVLGGVVGIALGLVAAGESRGRFLDSVFPPGDKDRRRDPV
jgi:hypothetical protein